MLGNTVETKTFLERTLGKEGSYCVFAFRTRDDKRIQKFYTSIGHVIDVANNLDKEGYDVYFALATFKKAGSRKVDNVKQLNTFFLDLDCGVSKDYKSQEDAIEALRVFCNKFKLPRPTMLNSGRGVHVYWFLTEPVGIENWLPVAELLKRLCTQSNLLADPAVTADAARVLRIPNTHNYKTNPPSKVGLLGHEMTEAIHINYFAELLGGDVIQVPKKRGQEINPILDALRGNIESVFKDILTKTQNGKGCEQLKYLIKNQKEVSEPLWRAGLSIAKHCIDRKKASHIISKNHPDYTQKETNRKMELIKGPYLCSTFDEYNPDVCVDCPNWGKIKSPIILGHRIKEATEEDNVVEAPAFDLPDTPLNKYIIPMYPKPYFRGVNGGVYIRSTNADGEAEDKLIYHNDLYVVRRLRDIEIG